MKIRTRLMILMFGLVAVSLALANLLSYVVNTAIVKNDIVTIQKVKTREAISMIDSFFMLHAQRVRDQSAHLYALIDLYKGDLHLSLERFLNSDALYREEALANAVGEEVVRVSRNTSFSEGALRNFSDDPLFLQTLKTKRCIQNDMQRNAFGEPVIELYCPVFDAKKTVTYVLVHRMNLKPLWDIFSSVTMGESGFAFVLDEKGYVIAHPDFSAVLSRTNIADLSIFKKLESDRIKLENNGGIINEEADGVIYSGGISKESGWVVIVRQGLSEAHRPLYTIAAVSIGGMAAFLVVGTIFAMTFSKRFTAPLRALNFGVKSIAEGDLDFMVQVQSNDEMGELSKGLNAMADSLQRTTVSRDYVDNIIASMLNSVIVASPEGQIKTVNKATCTLLAYREEELIGQNLSVVLREGLLPNAEEGALNVAGPFNKQERRYTTNTGSEIPVLFSASVMYKKDGEVQGIVCVAQDISELKRADLALKKYADRLCESNKELTDFAHVASHDLQEPLRKIMTFGDRLKQKCGDTLNEQGLDYIERMQNASQRMQKLIDGLLSFARVSTKAKPFEAVDLGKVVDDVLSDLEVRIEQSKGLVEVGVLPTIDADPLQMRQLFQNLIGNALKFSCPGEAPFVKVSSEAMNEKISSTSAPENKAFCKVILEDRGIGFDNQYAERIFGIFQRLHGKSEYEGSGIGLSVCKKIVERHAGTITASSAPGKGATFVLVLPMKQNRGEEANG